MKAPQVSVIVPVYDAEHQLPALLEALERQTLEPARFEVLVVDDGSTDATADLVTRSPVATLLSTPRRGGSYVARNVAVRQARGRVFAFTDADCTPAPDWLQSGLAALERTEAGLIAGRIRLPVGERPSAAALLDLTRHLDQQSAVRDGFGATANLWARREVFDRVGLFNENLISGGDTEFCHRAVASGALLEYAPQVMVEHPLRHRRAELARKAFRLGYGAAQQRHHAEGRLRERVHICRRPGAYVPHWTLPQLDRLDRHGVRPTAAQRMRMRVVQYVWVQLPIVAGNLRGTLAERRLGGRRGSPPGGESLATDNRAA